MRAILLDLRVTHTLIHNDRIQPLVSILINVVPSIYEKLEQRSNRGHLNIGFMGISRSFYFFLIFTPLILDCPAEQLLF